MSTLYKPLAHAGLPESLALRRPDQTLRRPVTPDSPAVEVMTDLFKVMPVKIKPNVPIEGANSKMIDHGVRLLFVTDFQLNIVGIITATDILGEKPMAHIQRHGGTRDDVLVRDIMTPREALQALDMKDVLKASVGDIVATLKEVGRQHTLVVERDRAGKVQYVRGLFSATQIGKQLNTDIVVGDTARTFVALERVLAS